MMSSGAAQQAPTQPVNAAGGQQQLFFFNYKGDTRKTTTPPHAPLTQLSDLLTVFKGKYADARLPPGDNYEFWTTDKQYGVRHKLENINDVYEGAVIEVVQAGQKRAREETAENNNHIPTPKRPRQGPRHVIRLRGLPWECDEKKVREFFEGIPLVECHVIFLANGRATGEAIVEVDDEEKAQKVMAKNKEYIGDRYIEVFKSSAEDMDRALGRFHNNAPMVPNYPVNGAPVGGDNGQGPANKANSVVRMRGLPYSALDHDIETFFGQAGVKPAKVHIVREEGIGRPSGNAYAEFSSEEDRAKAMTMDRKNLGSRYIELFESRMDELVREMGYDNRNHGYNEHWGAPMYNGYHNGYGYNMPQAGYGMVPPPPPAPMMNGGQGDAVSSNKHPEQPQQAAGDHCVRMRGLPYDCSEHEITSFFMEAGITPVRIHRKDDGTEAFVEFSNGADAQKAMSRHKAYIKHRYIELFRVSASEVAQVVGLPVAYGNQQPYRPY